MALMDIYWIFFIGGLIVTVILWLIGDVLEGILNFLFNWGVPAFQPITLTGGITAFGAAGLILQQRTDLPSLYIVASSAGIACLSFFSLYFLVVKPMSMAEASTGFRLRDLVGKKGEVILAIPKNGYGEVLVWTGGGNTNQIAASANGTAIPQGTEVIVDRVEDDTLWVSSVEKEKGVEEYC